MFQRLVALALAHALICLAAAAAPPLEEVADAVSAPVGNLLQNAEFTTDMSGWTPAVGTWQHSPARFTGDLFFVNPTGGSLFTTFHTTAFNSFNSIAQCVHLGPSPIVNFFEVYTNLDGGSLAGIGTGIDGEAIIQPFTSTDCTGSPTAEFRYAASPFPYLATNLQWTLIRAQGDDYAPAGTRSVKVFLAVVARFPESYVGAFFDRIYLGDRSAYVTGQPYYSCIQGTSSNLCLNADRFKVTGTWKASDGTSGPAGNVQLTRDSGFLWFFSEANIEVVVKVLNGCGLNNRYWVFVSGGTNVEVNLIVTDTKTGIAKTYKNPQGQIFKTIADVAAFATCP